MSINTLVIAGNLTADPTLRQAEPGRFVANFTIADTPRRKDSNSGQWIDGETLYQRVAVWGPAAENIAQSLTRGDRVMVAGRLTHKSYRAEDGQAKEYTEIQADEVAASLTFATAAITKTTRKN